MEAIRFEAVAGDKSSYDELDLALKDRSEAGFAVNTGGNDVNTISIAGLVANDVGEMVLSANARIGD